MYVVSVIDDGQERNFLAQEFIIRGDSILVDVAGAIHRFHLENVVEVIPVGQTAAEPSVRPRRLHS